MPLLKNYKKKSFHVVLAINPKGLQWLIGLYHISSLSIFLYPFHSFQLPAIMFVSGVQEKTAIQFLIALFFYTYKWFKSKCNFLLLQDKMCLQLACFPVII